MRKSIRVAVLGTAGAIVLTAGPIIFPANDSSGGVARPTPTTSESLEGDQRYFPSVGTVPVVMPSPTKSSEAPSQRPAAKRQEKTHESVSESPRASQKRVRDTPRATPTRDASKTTTSKPEPKKTRPPSEKVSTISGYAWCGSGVANAQPCIDAGKLTLYYPAGVATLAGHNYMGYDWMDDLPVGRKVKILSGSLAGTYVVYSHGYAARGSAGGKFPSAGYGAAVALQTCTKTGTGFSFLRRV